MKVGLGDGGSGNWRSKIADLKFKSRVGQTAANSAARCATLQAAISVATVPDPDHQNNQPNILD